MTCGEAVKNVPLGRCRHFEGNEHEVLHIAHHSEPIEPIGRSDTVLPVCSGVMLFNAFDKYPGFLRE